MIVTMLEAMLGTALGERGAALGEHDIRLGDHITHLDEHDTALGVTRHTFR